MKQDPGTNWRQPFMDTNYSAVKHQQNQISDHYSKFNTLGFFNQIYKGSEPFICKPYSSKV